jgi:glutamate racemase
MKNILVFDSGNGGRSLLPFLTKRLNEVEIHYVSDPDFFPYGNKTYQEIEDRVCKIILRENDIYKPDMIVIACNTASLCARVKLRSLLNIPIICFEPAIKPAAQLTQNGVIGLLATPATINHPSTNAMIKRYAVNIEVIKFGDNRLAELSEVKYQNSNIEILFPSNLIASLKTELAQADTIILGCTHYHLLENELSALLPNTKYFVSPITGVVNHIQTKLAA